MGAPSARRSFFTAAPYSPASAPITVVLIPRHQGDAAVFDSRLVHLGDANRSRSGVDRVLLCATFRNPKVRPEARRRQEGHERK